MTRIPPNINRNVLNTKAVSADTSALAIPETKKMELKMIIFFS